MPPVAVATARLFFFRVAANPDWERNVVSQAKPRRAGSGEAGDISATCTASPRGEKSPS